MRAKLLWALAPVILVGALVWRERFSGYHERLAEAHFEKSEELAHRRQFDASRREMELAVREDPKYEEARDGLAAIYAGEGRLEDAIRVYREGIALTPTSALLHDGLGGLLYSWERYDQALPVLEEAVRIKPDGPSVYLLGMCYERANRWPQAQKYWASLVERRPGDPIAKRGLSRVMARAAGKRRAPMRHRE
ncbi:MAG: tetratricopeptide repeat protein [Chthonomonadales bacterium]